MKQTPPVRARHRATVFALVLSASAMVLAGVGVPPAGADVATVTGRAFGYQTSVSLFGGPTGVRGFGQYPCTFEDPPAPPAVPDEPAGCTRANSGSPYNQPYSASESPSVVLPTTGGNVSQNDPDGARGTYGPAAIFSGIWPDNVAQAPPSGPISVSSQGTTGPTGSVTSSAGVVLNPTPVVVPCASNQPPGTVCTAPGGIGPGPVIADQAHSTCTASETGVTRSASFRNGVLETKYDSGTQLPTQTEVIPENPEPNYTRSGTIDHVGDSYTVIFNEQITNPDGSRTVNAVHMILEGPTAIGHMYIASSTCGVPVPAATRPPVADFNGNGITDIGVFRPSQGVWYVQPSLTVGWGGSSGDIPVPGDYDGDRDADIAIFRPSQGVWYLQGGATVGWGTNGDIPVPADYDGDAKTDIAVFRPSNGVWFVNTSGPGADITTGWGTTGDIPVPGDYDGDGDADIAIFRPSQGVWYVQGGATAGWGTTGDIPAPGDYDGDAKTDIAVFRPSNGVWFVNTSGPGADITTGWGSNGDVPVPGNYDGDYDTDIAVFRPSQGVWYVQGGPTVGWGTNGDIPLSLPAAIRRSFFP